VHSLSGRTTDSIDRDVLAGNVDFLQRTLMAYPNVALDTAKIHTPITLEFRRDAKPRVFLVQKRRPCGFDSHRPLHSRLAQVT
jgi:hypothetical protein